MNNLTNILILVFKVILIFGFIMTVLKIEHKIYILSKLFHYIHIVMKYTSKIINKIFLN